MTKKLDYVLNDNSRLVNDIKNKLEIVDIDMSVDTKRSINVTFHLYSDVVIPFELGGNQLLETINDINFYISLIEKLVSKLFNGQLLMITKLDVILKNHVVYELVRDHEFVNKLMTMLKTIIKKEAIHIVTRDTINKLSNSMSSLKKSDANQVAQLILDHIMIDIVTNE